MKTLKKYGILIIPILFFWFGARIELAKFGNDPNYVYLVNAAGLCTGHGVGYIDHPGTTVMQVGAATIAVKHLLGNPENESLLQHVFRDPLAFILAIRSVFLVLNTLVLLLLGWVAFRKTNRLWPALLLQVATLITTNSLDHVWTKISPAPLLFFITCLFVISVLLFYADENKHRWKYVVIFSLIAGAGIVTKATFLPVAVAPFFILPTLKRKIAYGLGIIPSFVLFSIPIIPEYKNMYYWFRGLSSHSGIYGHGEKGFIDWNTYFPNIRDILTNNPVFSLVVIIGGILILASWLNHFRSKKPLSESVKILTGLVAASAAGILLVAKHYHSNHYLIPELLLTGINLFFILEVLAEKNIPQLLKQNAGPVLVFLLIVLVAWKQPPRIRYINDGYKRTNTELDSVFSMIQEKYPDYTRIYYYPISVNLFSALNFGNVYSKQKMLPDLRAMYGDVYFLNTVTGTFQNWTNDVAADDIIEKNGTKILLVSGPRDENEVNQLAEKGFPLQKIYKGRLQAVYLLDTLRYNRLKSFRDKNIRSVVFCDMETVTADNQYFLGSNNGTFAGARARSGELAHSGNHSLRMDENLEYALENRLENLIPGDEYEIEVWRKSENQKGLLVVSSEDARLFYQAQGLPVKTGENGWELLRIRFKVTPELKDKTLKVYLWNKDRVVAFFDDLTITVRKPENL